MKIILKMNMKNKFYNKVQKIIPGGSQLLSKKPELFSPKNWPGFSLHTKSIQSCILYDSSRLYDSRNFQFFQFFTRSHSIIHSRVEVEIDRVRKRSNFKKKLVTILVCKRS